MFFSFPSADQVTKFEVTQEDEKQRPSGWKLCYSLFGWYYCLSWLVLIILTGIIGAWIWLYYEIYLSPNHTFAWQTLLRSFGSAYRLQCYLDGNHDKPVEFNFTEPQTNYQYFDSSWIECIPVSHSIPCIPVISIIILAVIIFSALACLLPVTMKVFDAGVAGVRANLGWQFFYSLLAIIIVSMFFDADSNALDDIMSSTWKSQIQSESKSEFVISKTWNITQTVGHCCGYTSFLDYSESIDGRYPMSCCNTKASNCTELPTSKYVWTQGCYIVEYNRVVVVGGFEIFLLIFQFVLSICLYYLVYMSNLEEHDKISRGFYFKMESESLPLIFPQSKPYE